LQSQNRGAEFASARERARAISSLDQRHRKRSINIFLGSVLSTICLTILAMIAVSYLTDHPLLLGVEHTTSGC
jgi:Ca2+:H+ antiporter